MAGPEVRTPTQQEEIQEYFRLRQKLAEDSATDQDKSHLLDILKRIPLDPGWSAYNENQKIMQFVMNSMREENPEEAELAKAKEMKDWHALQKVEVGERGGVYTYMENYKHPYKGFPLHVVVEWLDLIKKIGRGLISGSFHALKHVNKLKLIFLVPVAFFLPNLSYAVVFAVHRFLGRFRLKPQMYCDAVREIHRVFSQEPRDEKQQDREYRIMVRDLVCILLEFDNAYRYKLQEALCEIDQMKVRKKPILELTRILKNVQSRELIQDGKDTWSMILLAVRWFLRFDKRTLNLLGYVFSQIDLDKIKLDEMDKEFAGRRTEYKFKFMVEKLIKTETQT